MPDSLVAEVIEHFEALPQDLQAQVLALVRALDTKPRRGVTGRHLLRFAGTVPSADLEAMSLAIEQGCEQVDVHEW